MADTPDMNAMNKPVIEEFRANAGKVGGQFAGANLLLLNTIGARTGKPRTVPLVYLQDGERIIIIASFGGAHYSPPWYHNLVAKPEVDVGVGAERFTARASILLEPERSAVFEKVVAVMPFFKDYQANTTRVIPVIGLSKLN